MVGLDFFLCSGHQTLLKVWEDTWQSMTAVQQISIRSVELTSLISNHSLSTLQSRQASKFWQRLQTPNHLLNSGHRLVTRSKSMKMRWEWLTMSSISMVNSGRSRKLAQSKCSNGFCNYGLSVLTHNLGKSLLLLKLLQKLRNSFSTTQSTDTKCQSSPHHTTLKVTEPTITDLIWDKLFMIPVGNISL